jgi:hypothetical protein
MAVGARVHRAGQGDEQVEHGVEEHGDRQHVPGGAQGRRAALLAQQGEERLDDPVRRPAVHHRLAGDGGQRDDDPDAPCRAAEALGHASDLLRRLAGREQADHDRGGDQRQERVQAEQEDRPEDRCHSDQQDQQRMHGRQPV